MNRQDADRPSNYHNGLTNREQYTDPGTDTDGDGLSNKAEAKWGTNPNNEDSDGDGLSDGYEVANGLKPLKKRW